jgi:hypothetical protein
VSIAALINGIFNSIFLENILLTVVSDGRKSAKNVNKETSSKVNPSYLNDDINSSIFLFVINNLSHETIDFMISDAISQFYLARWHLNIVISTYLLEIWILLY